MCACRLPTVTVGTVSSHGLLRSAQQVKHAVPAQQATRLMTAFGSSNRHQEALGFSSCTFTCDKDLVVTSAVPCHLMV
jgi:hypothetical protein